MKKTLTLVNKQPDRQHKYIVIRLCLLLSVIVMLLFLLPLDVSAQSRKSNRTRRSANSRTIIVPATVASPSSGDGRDSRYHRGGGSNTTPGTSGSGSQDEQPSAGGSNSDASSTNESGGATSDESSTRGNSSPATRRK